MTCKNVGVSDFLSKAEWRRAWFDFLFYPLFPAHSEQADAFGGFGDVAMSRGSC